MGLGKGKEVGARILLSADVFAHIKKILSRLQHLN